MAELTTGKVIALIRALSTSSTSSATYTVTDALIVGAATTSGVRLDLESGTLAVREGDDSGYCQVNGLSFACYSGSTMKSRLAEIGQDFSSTMPIRWSSGSAAGTGQDTGLARDSAAQVVVTDGSTGIGNLRATALIVGTADTSGVRLDLESGTLAVREGDDSAYGSLSAETVYAKSGSTIKAYLSGYSSSTYYGVELSSDSSIRFRDNVSLLSGAVDTGLARDSAGQVKVTDGSTGVGNLRATALIVGTADTSGVRLDLESGVLAVREGDDSAYASMQAGDITCSTLNNTYRILMSGVNSSITAASGRNTLGGGNGQAQNTYFTATASSALTSGASYTFTGALPDGAIILGVTARITTTITGPTSVQVGDGTDADRYGIFSTLTSGQTITPADATASPLEWRAAAGDVVLTAVGGDFTAGVVRIVVHYITFTAPTS